MEGLLISKILPFDNRLRVQNPSPATVPTDPFMALPVTGVSFPRAVILVEGHPLAQRLAEPPMIDPASVLALQLPCFLCYPIP